MKISIITAVFNRKESILNSILSLQSQNYNNIEHIIVDGGSSDGTIDIVKSNYFNNIKFISEPDKGLYDAINKGILLSTGDVIGVLHSDDVYANSNVLSDIMVEFENSNIDAVYGDVAFFKSFNNLKFFRRYNSGRFNFNNISWGWMPAHSSLFFRKSVFDRYGYYKTDYLIAGDFDFIARVFKDNIIFSKYIPRVLLYMRSGGISSNGIRSFFILNKEVHRALVENNIKSNYFMILSKYPLKFLEFIIH